MPNRIVREGILDSDAVNKLTWAGEVFYRRLMSIVDDFGRYDARHEMLRAKLYPMRLDKVSLPDIAKWLTECVEAGLVRCYEVFKKPYLEIINFGQSLRIKKSKFPAPESTCKQMISDASKRMSESESESETKFYLKVAGEKIKIKPSEWLMRNKEEAVNLFLMHNSPGADLPALLIRFDSEYPHYDFDDHNHVFNAFKIVASKKKSSRNQDESKRQIPTLT